MSMLNKLTNEQRTKQKEMQTIYNRCEMGDKDACLFLQNGRDGYLLQGGMAQQAQVAPLGLKSSGMAEGGEALLAAPEEMAEEEMPGIEWAPLADVLGEEKFVQIAMLAEEFPVVAELAEMAMKTSDGFVEGEGGPKEDMVPARLSDGEYVISAAAVKEIGLENLEALHNEARAKAGAM
jgi:hypothetical protein